MIYPMLNLLFLTWIFHSSTNGIRIINTDDSDIEMVYHHFFKHSTHFSILEFIFFNEGCQAESICKEFISVHLRSIVLLAKSIKWLKGNFNLKSVWPCSNHWKWERHSLLFCTIFFRKILFPRMAIWKFFIRAPISIVRIGL